MRDPGLRENRRAEIQVGLLVVASFILIVLGVFWLSNTRVLDSGLRLVGTAPDAGQITSGARIYLLGVDVGSVTGVRIEGGGVVLSLRVDYEGTLPRDTRGMIVPAGFLGQQMVQLLPGSADRALADGDTIPLGRTPGLQSLAGQLGERADEVMARATDLLSEETVGDLRQGADALSSAMREIQGLVREERATLDELLSNLNRTSGRLAEATSGPELERTVARIDSLTAELARAGTGIDSASRSLASVLGKMDGGEGTLGLLVNDEELYLKATAAVENLQAASEEVALLTRDIRQRPERYLRGLKFSVF